ncbi:MAG: hypothetical protein GX248_06120 [Peptococcaceae bacterium]|jgi:predicted Fe-Mo cluster-binding NifX family protein|nr:hypothetical protein [Peptococcaceae bacterium]
MLIAVAANGETLEDRVAKRFEDSTCLLIVNMEDMSFEVFKNHSAGSGSGIDMAKIITEKDCEAVITGSIKREAFEELIETQVTRYNGADYTAREALDLMEKYRLDLVRYYEGEDPDFHMLHRGSCDCSDH